MVLRFVSHLHHATLHVALHMLTCLVIEKRRKFSRQDHTNLRLGGRGILSGERGACEDACVPACPWRALAGWFELEYCVRCHFKRGPNVVWVQKGWRAKISRFFFSSFHSLWSLWTFFQTGPPGLAHDDQENSKTCTFEGSNTSNTTEIPRKDAQREHKECNFRREEEKQSEIVGGLADGGPAEGGIRAGVPGRVSGGGVRGWWVRGVLRRGFDAGVVRGRFEKINKGEKSSKKKNESKNNNMLLFFFFFFVFFFRIPFFCDFCIVVIFVMFF